jgi:Zn-dependent protease with chaperone function
MSVFTKKLVIFVMLCFSFHIHAISLDSLSPYTLIDRYLAKHYGSEVASPWYHEKTVEFLKLSGVINADQVNVRKLSFSQSVNAYSQFTFINYLPGLTLFSGIWFNESILEKMSEENKLWVIAHEAAHYRLGHGMSIPLFNYVTKMIPVVYMTGFMGASLLGFNWISKKVSFLQNHHDFSQKMIFMLSGLYFGAGLVKIQPDMALAAFAFQKECEKAADIQAAKMLCEHGYAYIVECHVKTLQEAIAKGLVLLNGYNHPSFQEQLTYLHEFLKTYRVQNPVPVTETVLDIPQQSLAKSE